jgi:hypothetical protein
VSERVAQVHDDGVEVVGEAAGGRLVAGVLEIVDQDLEAELAVLDSGGFVERAPVVEADAVVFCLGSFDWRWRRR